MLRSRVAKALFYQNDGVARVALVAYNYAPGFIGTKNLAKNTKSTKALQGTESRGQSVATDCDFMTSDFCNSDWSPRLMTALFLVHDC